MGDIGETGDTGNTRDGQLVRLWSVYVIFVKMFVSKIRTLFFLLII